MRPLGLGPILGLQVTQMCPAWCPVIEFGVRDRGQTAVRLLGALVCLGDQAALAMRPERQTD